MTWSELKERAIALWTRLYRVTIFYRLFWVGVSASAGWASVQFGADPQYGFLVVLLTTALTSTARQHLGDANFGAEAEAKKAKRHNKAAAEEE